MKYPKNCFLLFCEEERNNLVSLLPNRSNSEITSILGYNWRHLPEEKKAKFQEKAQQELKKFKLANPTYKRKKHDFQKFTTTFKFKESPATTKPPDKPNTDSNPSQSNLQTLNSVSRNNHQILPPIQVLFDSVDMS
eukprot:CAMPEP_0206190804 /NCGR_PEP_ID=MMETSP0166-20121206/4961_1 /ASSEMBLY_ACC=CAM_ASM_000260 /TAXON_ID=95228 /ORGANISM="Vannella robusta, Strain DIVA3 518/3/11/1/6" /LENGTH=135 /DNA_ID=CAMNT_0053606939 /DNA_START=11 /DNA_END=415 /DNA_ORIENTATION=-